MTRPRAAVAVLLGELALVDLLGQRLLERRDHRVGGLLLAAAHDDLVARLGRHFGHARAHDPGTDDADTLDGHGPELTRR